MGEKYIRRDGLPLLLRHTGPTTLPEAPPEPGRGPTIVCLHDAGLQSSFFGDLLGEIADDARAIAFDQPGHGRSGSLDALPSIEAMAEMALWVASWCGSERVLLVGHGMGALVALECAQRHPETIAGLVLCGTGLSLGIDEATIETMRNVTRGKAPRPFDPGRVAQSSGPEMMRRAYMEGIQTDPRATLVDLEASRAWTTAFESAAGGAGVGCPATILAGDAEPDAHRRRAAALVDALPNASLVTLTGAAHFLPLEQPGALGKAIRNAVEAA